MLRTFVVPALALLPAVAAAQQPAEILAKVVETYSKLKAVHIVASRSEGTTAGGYNGFAEAEYELAAKGAGSHRVRFRNANAEALVVSDGAVTWKALPKEKQWSRQELAAVEYDEDEDADPRRRDLRATLESMLLRRPLFVAKNARDPQLLKDESYKLDGSKVACFVVRAEAAGSLHELWIDKSRFLVLRHIETGNMRITEPRLQGSGVVAKLRFDTKVRSFAVDAEVLDRVFQFEPESKWKQAEFLVLPGEERVLLTGSPAGTFKLKSLDGESFELASLKGSPVVLDFWATWCPPCRKELPALEKLREEFAGKVQFFGVNDEETGLVKAFLKKHSYTMPTLVDGRREVHRKFGVRAIPTLLVIDREGVIRTHFIGSRDEQTLRSAIQSVLP